MIAEDALETARARAPRGVRARAARSGRAPRRRRRGGRGEPVTRSTTPFLARRERFDARRLDERRRPRLAGRRRRRRSASRSPTSRRPVAAATAGRGPRRPARRCCCRSASGRPGWRPDRSGGWRRSSRSRWPRPPRTAAGLPAGTIRLKWPNDLVVATRTDGPAASASSRGVLGETDGLGTDDPRAVVGIGHQRRLGREPTSRRSSRPTMTSLRELAGRPPIDRDALLDAFLARARGARRRPPRGPLRRRRLDGPPGHDRRASASGLGRRGVETSSAPSASTRRPAR